METCICMAKSLHCSPITITTLFIGYIPIQKKSIRKKKKQNKRSESMAEQKRLFPRNSLGV